MSLGHHLCKVRGRWVKVQCLQVIQFLKWTVKLLNWSSRWCLIHLHHIPKSNRSRLQATRESLCRPRLCTTNPRPRQRCPPRPGVWPPCCPIQPPEWLVPPCLTPPLVTRPWNCQTSPEIRRLLQVFILPQLFLQACTPQPAPYCQGCRTPSFREDNLSQTNLSHHMDIETEILWYTTFHLPYRPGNEMYKGQSTSPNGRRYKDSAHEISVDNIYSETFIKT